MQASDCLMSGLSMQALSQASMPSICDSCRPACRMSSLHRCRLEQDKGNKQGLSLPHMP